MRNKSNGNICHQASKSPFCGKPLSKTGSQQYVFDPEAQTTGDHNLASSLCQCDVAGHTS
jgi:hypothetical protein